MELAERVAVIVTAAVLEACISFLIPDEEYRDLQFVVHVFYYLFRSSFGAPSCFVVVARIVIIIVKSGRCKLLISLGWWIIV